MNPSAIPCQATIWRAAALLLCTLAQFASAQNPQCIPPVGESVSKAPSEADKITLPPHTPVALRLKQTVSSQNARPGQEVAAEILRDVVVNGLVVIQKETPVSGTVVRVQPKGRWMQNAGLLLKFDRVKTVTGEEVLLQGSAGDVNPEEPGVAKKDVAGFVLNPAYTVFAPFLLIGLKHGHDLRLLEGTRVIAYTVQALELSNRNLQRTQPLPSNLPGFAVVYFGTGYVQRSRNSGECWRCRPVITVLCGRVSIGRVGFLRALVPPGHYACRGEHFQPTEFTFLAGNEYFVRVLVDPGQFHAKSIWLEDLSQKEGYRMWNIRLAEGDPDKASKDFTKTDVSAFRETTPPQ